MDNATITPSPGELTLSPSLQMILIKMTGDMKFIGLVEIIFGAIYCLSIIGALIGVPSIIAGIRLRDSADGFRAYMNSHNAYLLEGALEHQSRFFFIHKVLAIILVVMMVLFIIFYFFIFLAYLSGSMRNGY